MTIPYVGALAFQALGSRLGGQLVAGGAWQAGSAIGGEFIGFVGGYSAVFVAE